MHYTKSQLTIYLQRAEVLDWVAFTICRLPSRLQFTICPQQPLRNLTQIVQDIATQRFPEAFVIIIIISRRLLCSLFWIKMSFVLKVSLFPWVASLCAFFSWHTDTRNVPLCKNHHHCCQFCWDCSGYCKTAVPWGCSGGQSYYLAILLRSY